MTHDWLHNLNIDLGLIEVRDDPDTCWERRALAGASVGVDPQAALVEAYALCCTIDRLLAGDPDGKRELAEILGDDRNDYQRCLWYTLAGRHTFAIATDLRWLVALLRARDDQWEAARKAGRPVTKEPEPYVSDRADGPLGLFDQTFDLGPQWQGIAEGV
ncbi:hypothetical protein [Novosphingobium sp. MD-1]|uniref:hypothetical protein n=1 Tax=Novosphingobium sp. MD-1 TaxID=1630648 RepID=UPI00061C2F73|nr:hypothetical protein [Novosphingobium sp. MD-1]GAO52922.1 hypothetical protein NMD1_00889 [Novosphingobium sp. MD-1]